MLIKIKKALGYIKHSEILKFYDKLVYTFDYNKEYEKCVMKASHLYHNGGLSRLYAIFLHRRNRRKFPCEIYPQVKIEGKIIIPHSVGIVIGKTATIGDGTKIMPNVVIGASYSPYHEHSNEEGRRHAIIGKNCVIGANSVIIGPITIGDKVTVGAGAIVTYDVPPNCIVTGVNQVRKIIFK